MLSKNTSSRKPSVQPVIQFNMNMNMPTLTLESRNLTVKDSDSEYTYNPRQIGHNMNSMLSRQQTQNENESGFIDHNNTIHDNSALSGRNLTAGNRSLANKTRMTYASSKDSVGGPLLTDQTDVKDQFKFGKRTYDGQVQFKEKIVNYAPIPDSDISRESDFITGRDRCKQ